MENSDSENLNLVNKLLKFLKHKNKSFIPRKIYKKRNQGLIYTCYECSKQDHINLIVLY